MNWTTWHGLRKRTDCSAASTRRLARIALAARPPAHQRQLAALGAGVAFVAFHAGLADLVGQDRDAAAVAAVAVRVTAAGQGLQMLGARRLERFRDRLRLDLRRLVLLDV